MKRGFYTIMSAQFFSSLADNALFVTAVELLRTSGAPEWQRAALVPMFALFYVILAPFVGPTDFDISGEWRHSPLIAWRMGKLTKE